MVQSSRRFKEIAVDTGYWQDEVVAQRIAAVVGTFKGHMKSLEVKNFPRCSEETYSNFLDTACDVEKFTIHLDKRSFNLRKDFTKLKQLFVSGARPFTRVLDKVPDDTLEALTIASEFYDRELTAESVQSFLNRQTILKKLDVSSFKNLNLDHLELEELSIWHSEDDEQAALLKKQSALRRFHSQPIGKQTFTELRKMKHLESLSGRMSEELTGELGTIKELVLYDCDGEYPALRNVAFTNLKKLILDTAGDGSLEPHDFVTLSRSSPNLQHLETRRIEINFLTVVVEQFPALKTLMAQFYDNVESFGPAPSYQNLSLEELIVIKLFRSAPTESLFEILNACPNLKRIQLHGINFTLTQVLDLMRSHPALTHFWFSIRQWYFTSALDSEAMDPSMAEIINVFVNSPHFVYLAMIDIDENFAKIIEGMLRDAQVDNASIVTTVTTKYFGYCNLTLVKKSSARDPHKISFEENARTYLNYIHG